MGLGISMGTKAAQAITVPPVIVTFLGAFPGGVSGLNIGSSRNDRMIVVFATGESDGSGQLDSCTIGAANGTIFFAPSSSDPTGAAGRFVPASEGSSINISASMRGLSVINVYMITGISTGLLSGGSSLSISGGNATAAMSPGGYLKGAVIGFARSVSSGSGFSADSSGGINFWAVNVSYNQGGGGNPSAACASGLLDGSNTTANINILNSSGWSSGYGWAGVFV